MGNCFVRHRGGKKKLKTRSLYSFCTNINQSGTYSEIISGIKYDIECVTVPEVTDSNVDTIFSSVSSNEGYFLLLKTNHINISKTLTPPYPKKSLIIFCKNIEGTGTISMTGKGPNCLPEDILLFEKEELPEAGKVLIPAYANNAKIALNVTGNSNQAWCDRTNGIKNRKGNDGTGYNCGSGGIGGIGTTSSSADRANLNFYSGSGYSYGGGAGTCAHEKDGTVTYKVDTTYPMRGLNYAGSNRHASGGVGNPCGSSDSGVLSRSSLSISNGGVGGRIIVFCKFCEIKNLEAKGVNWILNGDLTTSDYNYFYMFGGSSGGGSINIFYSEIDSSTKNVSSSSTSGGNLVYYGSNINHLCRGGAGGNGTVVNIKCKYILI